LALARRRADAEDLVQAVFLKLASSGTELLGVRTPAAYLHRMLHTIWIDQERRRITGERLVDRADAATREAASVGGEWTLDLARALDALPAALAMNRRQSSWQADYAGNGALPPWLAIRRLSQVLYISARIAVASSRPEDASARIATGLAVAASIR
jgi:hypothetical protein